MDRSRQVLHLLSSINFFVPESTQQEWEADLMQKIVIATLMAFFFGLFSMPISQATPANGASVGSALKSFTSVEQVQWRRRRRRRSCGHRWRSRSTCWWF
jgi:hypothetical protein